MKPALSVILFTVLSGAGLGALALTALAEIFAHLRGLPSSWSAATTAATAIALVLVIAGLCASTLHLANPRNAWRSLTRWRSSWLSREALVALVLIPVAGAYVALHAFGIDALTPALAVLVVLLAWALLYCTAMIYASLKPIRQWHTARVPLAFVLLGHASGALLIVCALAAGRTTGDAWIVTAGALLVAALVAKLEYWHFVGGRGITLESALGVPHGVAPPRRAGAPRQTVAARLLDVGHSKGTFLTDEFVVTHAASMRNAMRAVALVAGFGIPLLWLVTVGIALPVPGDGRADWRIGATAWLLCMVGFAAERWLFFADARHTVRLYHGDRTT
jgi:DMSO reductase anchor subunit